MGGYAAAPPGGSGTVKGTGAAGQVAFWSAVDTIAGDNGLFWDNVNKRLGIGTTTPNSFLHNAGNWTMSKRVTTLISYAALASDFYIGLIPVPPVPITITLPTAASPNVGRIYVIADEVGGVGVGTELTIAAQAGETVDNAASKVFNIADISVTVLSLGGSKWKII